MFVDILVYLFSFTDHKDTTCHEQDVVTHEGGGGIIIGNECFGYSKRERTAPRFLLRTDQTDVHPTLTRQKFRRETPAAAQESVKMLSKPMLTLLRGFAVNERWNDVLRVIRDMKAMGMQQGDLAWAFEIRACFFLCLT